MGPRVCMASIYTNARLASTRAGSNRRGEGVFLIDENGKKYYDGVSSLWVNIHGHNHPVLNQALKDQSIRLLIVLYWG